MSEPFQFTNTAPENKEWSAHIELLNRWTPAELQLRHIVACIRSGAHFPKDMHVDLIQQHERAHANEVIGDDEALTFKGQPIGQSQEVVNRNLLRKEQRERNK